MKPLIITSLTLLAMQAECGVLYDQPHNGSGGLTQSSWLNPDGYDGDWFAYDSFRLPATANIGEMRWRGGYVYGGMFGKAFSFNIKFYASIAGDWQPYCANPDVEDSIYLAAYQTNFVPNEVFAGNFGGTSLYDYRYVLPTPFHAVGGVKYWVKILADQPSVPDWGLAYGNGPDHQHFKFSTGMAQFHFYSGDTAYSLYSPSQDKAPASYTITEGTRFTGNLHSLAASDDDRLVAFDDSNTLGATVQVTSLPSTISAPSMIEVDIEHSATRPSLSVAFALKNYASNVFEPFFGDDAPVYDRLDVIQTTDAAYRAANGQITVQVQWAPINDEVPSQDGWGLALDYVNFHVEG